MLQFRLELSTIFVCFLTFTDSREVCLTYGSDTDCKEEEVIRLPRFSGKNVSIVNDGQGGEWTMKTINDKPLILEIEDFLNPEECDHLIQMSIDAGLQPSVTVQPGQQHKFVLLDQNHDNQLTVDEMKQSIKMGFDIYMENDDILEMYRVMHLDKDNNALISREEMENTNPSQIRSYLTSLMESHPEKHSRYSQQTWLYPGETKDSIFINILSRVSNIFYLPMELLMLSDFQVVKYGVFGHYNAHYDSSVQNKAIPCCDKQRKKKCRICRYMTVFLYLNDVEKGGETAFPLAGKDNIQEEEVFNDEVTNLFKNCNDGMQIKPEKGKVIIWYNHFVDPDNDWLGSLDYHTLHGGCPVHNGSKWVANLWVKTTDWKVQDLHKLRIQHMKISRFRKKDKFQEENDINTDRVVHMEAEKEMSHRPKSQADKTEL